VTFIGCRPLVGTLQHVLGLLDDVSDLVSGYLHERPGPAIELTEADSVAWLQ
jgi:hypothetical protein